MSHAWSCWARYAEKERGEVWAEAVVYTGEAIRSIQEIEWRVDGVPYPFEHTQGITNTRQFLTDNLPHITSEGEQDLHRVQGFVERMVECYTRCLGRIARITRETETAVGIERAVDKNTNP